MIQTDDQDAATVLSIVQILTRFIWPEFYVQKITMNNIHYSLLKIRYRVLAPKFFGIDACETTIKFTRVSSSS